MITGPLTLRVATVPEAAIVATLLDTFNREDDTPIPGTTVLATRLRLRRRRDITQALAAAGGLALSSC